MSEVGKLWEYRKTYVQKLFDAIDKDLIPVNWSITDPDNITSEINFHEEINNQKKPLI